MGRAFLRLFCSVKQCPPGENKRMHKKAVECETQVGRTSWVAAVNVRLRTSAYGILLKIDHVFVIQAHLPLWEFPGGAPEAGETLLEAVGAIRYRSAREGTVRGWPPAIETQEGVSSPPGSCGLDRRVHSTP